MRQFLLVVLISSLVSIGFAQTPNCPQTLRLAQATYDQGRLHEVEALLGNCLRNGFNTQEKVTAYKILCLTYLYLEEPEKADEAMLNILHTDPYFKVNESADPAEFVALYKTFRTDPIYRLGINLGVNASQPNVSSAIKTNNGDSEYKYGIAFQVGVNGEIPLRNKLTLNPSIHFQTKTYNVTSTVDRGVDISGEPLKNETTGKEALTWVSVPVAVQYQVLGGQYQPYVSLGLSGDYLIKSVLTTETIQDNAGAVQERKYDPEREKLNLSVIASAGGKLRIFGGYFTAEVRYYYGIKKVNSDKTYYKNSEIAFNNDLGDSLFKLNSLSVTVGYVQNIFNPKKLKRRK